MPRTACRLLAVSAAFVGLAALAAGQNTNLKAAKMEGKPPSDPGGKLARLRDGKLNTGGPDAKANQELLRAAAKYHVYKATDEKYYLPPETGDLKPRDTAGTFDQVMTDVGGLILQPGPDTKYSTVQKEYNDEAGAALNEAVRDVLKANPPAPIRVNAGRLLALGARSGAGAFAPTIHELLTHSFPLDKGKAGKTPPELFLYALKAAENLFAAYDPVWHLNQDWKSQFRHSFPEKDQITLARDLLDLLAKGPGMADLAAPANPDTAVYKPVTPGGPAPTPADAPPPPAEPAGKLEATTVTPEQAAVTQYFRRHVAAAVSKIRPDLLGEVGQPPLRPGVAVAQIAVGDASLNPPVTTPEVADAVLGLCHILPSQNFNIPEALAALAAGGQTVVREYNIRNTNPAVGRHARLVPWRVYAERLNAALDHLTRQAAQNPRWRDHRAAVAQLVGTLRDDVVTPLRRDDANTQVSAERLTDFLRNRQGVPKAERSLYTNDPAFALTPRPAGS